MLRLIRIPYHIETMKPIYSTMTLFVSLLLFTQCTSQDEAAPDTTTIVVELSQSMILANAAEALNHICIYTSKYQQIEYPCGDISSTEGVCTDVVIRAFKGLDRCLQQEIHEFRKTKGLSTDSNIDHRRVPNQGQYFESLGMMIDKDSEILPGDIIWWKLPGNDMNHIGVVVADGNVMHNIGHGQWADATPYDYPIHRIYRLVE